MPLLRRWAVAITLPVLSPLGLLASEPLPEVQSPAAAEACRGVAVRDLEAIPVARDPWAIRSRFSDGWDDRMREPRPAASGATRTLRFHFEGPRSLAAAVDALVCRHGLFLNYEDAPWVARQDVQAPAAPAPAAAARSVRVRVPANDRLG